MGICCFHGLISSVISAGITPKSVAMRLVGSARDDYMAMQGEPRNLHGLLVFVRQFQRKHDRNAVGIKDYRHGVDLSIDMENCAAALAEAKLVELMLHRAPTFLVSVRLEWQMPSESHEPHELWAKLKAVQSVATRMLNSESIFQHVRSKFEEIRELPDSEFDDGAAAEEDVDDLIREKMQEMVWPFVSAVVQKTPGQSRQVRDCARQLLLALDSKPMVSTLQSKNFLVMVWKSWHHAHEVGRLSAKADGWIDTRDKLAQSLRVTAFKCWWLLHCMYAPAGSGRASENSLLASAFRCWSTASAVAKHQAHSTTLQRHATVEFAELAPRSAKSLGDSDLRQEQECALLEKQETSSCGFPPQPQEVTDRQPVRSLAALNSNSVFEPELELPPGTSPALRTSSPIWTGSPISRLAAASGSLRQPAAACGSLRHRRYLQQHAEQAAPAAACSSRSTSRRV